MTTDGPNTSISLTTEDSNELMIVVIYTVTTLGSFLYLILTYSCVTKWLISGLRFTPFYSNYSKKKLNHFSLFIISKNITLALGGVSSTNAAVK